MSDVSSHLRTRPSRLVGSMHLAHWQPVEIGSAGATIISTFSFLWTTPITLTVLPSLMYLQHKQPCQNEMDSHCLTRSEDANDAKKKYPSFRRMIRSSLERFLPRSHLRNSGDMSLLSGFMSITTDSSTYGVTRAPDPVLTSARSPD
jgi:hypothetical protein